MTPKLTPQQEKVYRCILENRGITSKEIMLKTGIQCPSGRIAELRDMGVKIISIGHKKYEGSRAFEMYAIHEPLMKDRVVIEVIGNTAYKRIEKVLV